MVEMLLEWNKSLASEVDSNGSTPLHFASSRLYAGLVRRSFYHYFLPVSFLPRPIGMLLLLEAYPAALYQPDNHGMFPIHVAAYMDADLTVARFIRCHPNNAGLRDRRGRTFLHTAAENSRRRTVRFACRTPSLGWILNMQDADGNTPLHLATQAGSLLCFTSLLGNHQVHLNLANKKRQTPLDISQLNIPPGIYHAQVNLSSHSVEYFCTQKI
jgi:ankyrin repeat protein